MTEKEIIEKILRQRGIIDNEGKFNQTRFRKLVTEPWVHTKTLKYGFDKIGDKKISEIQEEVKEVVIEEQPIDNQIVVEEVVEAPIENDVVNEQPVTEPEVVEDVKEEVVEDVKEAPKAE